MARAADLAEVIRLTLRGVVPAEVYDAMVASASTGRVATSEAQGHPELRQTEPPAKGNRQ